MCCGHDGTNRKYPGFIESGGVNVVLRGRFLRCPPYALAAQLVGVQGRDWRLFRKNLISKYGRDDSRATWGEGCWAHEIGEVEPVSFLHCNDACILCAVR